MAPSAQAYATAALLYGNLSGAAADSHKPYEGEMIGVKTMRPNKTTLDLLIGAMLKLSNSHTERQNVLAFIQSCYCGRVRSYDLDAALQALARITEEEQHALIAWMVASDDAAERRAKRSAA
jgi:hypothetical protein